MSKKELNLEDVDGEPAIIMEKGSRELSIRNDVADYLEAVAKDLDISFEETIDVVLVVGLYSLDRDPKHIRAEWRSNPKIMALFR